MRASVLCLRLRCGGLAGHDLLLSLLGAALLGHENYNVEARWPVELKLEHDCVIALFCLCHAGGGGERSPVRTRFAIQALARPEEL